jgi:hypothetical protein
MENSKTYEARHHEKQLDAILKTFRSERERMIERLEGLASGEILPNSDSSSSQYHDETS